MREKHDRLKVYEFLYNRVPFSDDETAEYHSMQKMEHLESEFERHLMNINTKNMSVHWHAEMHIGNSFEIVNVLITTDYCYYLFVLHDLSGPHYINQFNILCTAEHEAVIDLNRSRAIFEMFRGQLIDEGHYQRPIILKYVMMDPSFKIESARSELFLKLSELPHYLKTIEHSAVIRKKNRHPASH